MVAIAMLHASIQEDPTTVPANRVSMETEETVVKVGIFSNNFFINIDKVIFSIYLVPIDHIRILGTSLELRGIFSNANEMKIFLMIFPRISLHCKLDRFSL